MKVTLGKPLTKYGQDLYSEEELTEIGLKILKLINDALACGSWNVRWHGGLWLDNEHFIRYSTVRYRTVIKEIIIEYTNRG